MTISISESQSEVADRIKAEARALGFDLARITSVDAIPDAAPRLWHFLREGRHGEMDWMALHANRREQPRALWPAARSAILLGLNYGPEENPLPAREERTQGMIAVYAKGKDYHSLMKKRLKRLAGWVHRETGAEVKFFVDTAPLMEKPLAAAAGLGWQGKHTNLVSRELGSWFFLAAILTPLELPPDAPEEDHCGECQACLDICPTGAFPAPRQLDARRCISYLTIEHKTQIAAELRPLMGNHIFGCDDCLAICPWNKFAQTAKEMALHPRIEADDPPLEELVRLDEAEFRTRFAGTPIKRTGRDRFVRNVLIAIGNSGENKYIPLLHPRLEDASPLVRGMAIWALARLLEPSEFSRLRDHYLSREEHAEVALEWGED